MTRLDASSDRAVTPGTVPALAAWGALIVTLSMVGHPLVVAASFAGSALLAVRRGHARLLAVAMVGGAAMLLVVPGATWADGSFDIAYTMPAAMPDSIGSWVVVLVGALRFPAQILAVTSLMLVPAPWLLATAARWSPRAALLGGLVARLRPLLARDLVVASEQLRSSGVRGGEPRAGIGARIAFACAVGEVAVAGMLDRAFQTAAALQTRGYGAGVRVESAPLLDPRLATVRGRTAMLDRSMLVAAVALVGCAVTGRLTGAVQAPALSPLASDAGAIDGLVLVTAALAAWCASAPLWCGVRLERHASPARGSDAMPPARATGHPVGSGDLLQLVDVSMRYPGATRDSLVQATVTVRAGDIVLAAGASGSGKSTMLDVVTGIAPHATGGHVTGVVRLGSQVVTGLGRGGLQVAAVFQQPEAQVLVGIVAEEVAFGLRHRGVPVEQIEARVLQVLESLGLLALARRDCATLSGGELQRVLLAAALVVEPDLLVLDEPTSQIDAISERQFWTAVEHARASRAITVLVAEHRLDHVRLRADRVLVFEAGRIVADVAPGQLGEAAPGLVAAAYEGLVPAPIRAAAHGPARLALRIDRLDVGDGGTRGRTVLRGVGADLQAGSIVTLEGPNGSGKSTLLRSIRGLHPVTGSIRVDGVEHRDVAGSARWLGYLAQGAGVHLTGRTILDAAAATSRRLSLGDCGAITALHAAGLGDRLQAHPADLSVGERQRLALVAATAHRPPIWLLDEPTRGMDAAARRWVALHAVAHAASGGVVLVATHDPALAAAIATHRLRLDLQTGPSIVRVPRDPSGRLIVDERAADQARTVVQP